MADAIPAIPAAAANGSSTVASSSFAAANTGGVARQDGDLLLTMLDSDLTVDFKHEMGLLHTITHTFATLCAATNLSIKDLGNSETIYGEHENLTLHISICSQLYLTPAEHAVCLLAGRLLIPTAASGFLDNWALGRTPPKSYNISMLIIRIVKFFADCSTADFVKIQIGAHVAPGGRTWSATCTKLTEWFGTNELDDTVESRAKLWSDVFGEAAVTVYQKDGPRVFGKR
eukprot:COSAG01_NODE_12408_length_1745_cov_6.230863_1_plen_230_part_00